MSLRFEGNFSKVVVKPTMLYDSKSYPVKKLTNLEDKKNENAQINV